MAYYIISLQDNQYLDISDIQPAIIPPPSLTVIGLPQDLVSSWVMLILCITYKVLTDFDQPLFAIKPVSGGCNTYTISIKNRNTCSQENLLFACKGWPAEEWVITYRELQHAYIIERRGESVGWTAPLPGGGDYQVTLSPLITAPSLPPQFLPHQLFRLECVPEE
ncbi:hypothetical protein EDC04DRAFT_2598807 [Pisolithus marmoratus]|nr:hypothetical protein EDC04DRAFT_2598807 [Pisolithus marmoratus]